MEEESVNEVFGYGPQTTSHKHVRNHHLHRQPELYCSHFAPQNDRHPHQRNNPPLGTSQELDAQKKMSDEEIERSGKEINAEGTETQSN